MTNKLVKIKIENAQGEEVTKEVNVKRLRVFQYGNVMKIVGGLTRRVTEDEALMNTVKTQFFNSFDEDWKDQDTGQLLESVKGKLQGDLIGSVGFALEQMPDELINLIAVASNLQLQVVQQLEDEDFLNLITAIVEVNDLQRLQELGKKFSESLKEKFETKASKEKQREHLQSVTE